MRRPTRNLLYVLLGFVCVALLVQGVGLHLPRVLKMLTAVSSTAISSPSSSPSPCRSRHSLSEADFATRGIDELQARF